MASELERFMPQREDKKNENTSLLGAPLVTTPALTKAEVAAATAAQAPSLSDLIYSQPTPVPIAGAMTAPVQPAQQAPTAAALPDGLGTWADLQNSPQWKQGSTERRQSLERAWLDQVKQYALTIEDKGEREAFRAAIRKGAPLTKSIERTLGGALMDRVNAFASGANTLAGQVGTLVNFTARQVGVSEPFTQEGQSILGDMLNPELAEARAKAFRDEYSQKLKDDLKVSAERVQAAGEGEFGKFRAAIGAAWDRPDLIVNLFAENVPQMVATLGAAGTAGRVASALSTGFKTLSAAEAAAAAQLATKAARGTAVAAGSALTAGDAISTNVETMRKATEEQWRTDPEYNELRKTVGEEEAKRQIALDRSKVAALIGMVAGGVGGAFGVEQLLGKAAKAGLMSRLGRFAAEPLGEIPEEVGPQIEANRQLRRLAPDTQLLAGTGEVAAQAVLAGAGPGAIAAIGSTAPEEAQATPTQPEPSAPSAPEAPTGPETFRQRAAKAIGTLQTTLDAIRQNPDLSEAGRVEQGVAIEEQIDAWTQSAMEFEATPTVRRLQGEVEAAARRLDQIASSSLDDATKASLSAPLTKKVQRAQELASLADLDENDLESYVRDREQALLDIEGERGTGAKVTGENEARLLEERAIANQILDERSLVETPSDRAFAAQERSAFPKDNSGNYVYPTAEELGALKLSDALSVIANIAASRIYDARANTIYRRSERAQLIRMARQIEESTARAKELLTADEPTLATARADLTQGLINLFRQGRSPGDGRLHELAAIIYREQQLQGREFSFGEAQSIAARQLADLARQDTTTADSGIEPPAPPAPPDPDKQPGGDTEGYALAAAGKTYKGSQAITKDEIPAFLAIMRSVTSVPNGFTNNIIRALGARFSKIQHGYGYVGFYCSSSMFDWQGQVALDMSPSGSGSYSKQHTAAHELGHALDDILRTGSDAPFISQNAPEFSSAGVYVKEIADWYAKRGAEAPLYFHYPLMSGSGSPRDQAAEYFAQIVAYYHADPSTLKSRLPKTYAFAERLFNGLRQLESSGQLDAASIADTVRQAISGHGGPAVALDAGAGADTGGATAQGAVRAGAIDRNAQPGVASEVQPGAEQASVLGAVDEAARAVVAAVSANPETAEQDIRSAIEEVSESIAAAQTAAAPRLGAATPAPSSRTGAPTLQRGTGRAKPQARTKAAADQPTTGAKAQVVVNDTAAAQIPGEKATRAEIVQELARIFGRPKETIMSLLPKVVLAEDSNIQIVASEGPNKDTLIIMPDGRTVKVGSGTLAFHWPERNQIVLLTTRIPKDRIKAVIFHELFHKRGGQILGRKRLQQFRRQIEKWANARRGSPERIVYDRAIQRVNAVAFGAGEPVRGNRRYDEELVPYFIEEAIVAGYLPSKRPALNRPGIVGALTQWSSWVRRAIADLFGVVPRVDVDEMLLAAYGAANLELPDAIGTKRVESLMQQSSGFLARSIKEQIERGAWDYNPDEATPAQRALGVRPSQINPIYGDDSIAESSIANAAWVKLPAQRAAPMKTRAAVQHFVDTGENPTAQWLPQAKDKFIENWQDAQRPVWNWIRDNGLDVGLWRALKLIPGRIRALLQRYNNDVLDPIHAEVAKFAQQYKIGAARAAQVVGYWATMRHVPEANAQLRKKIVGRVGQGDPSAIHDLRRFDETQRGAHPNDNDPDRGAMAGGWSDAEATAIGQKLESEFAAADLERIGNMIVDGFAKMKAEAIASGQISKKALQGFPKFKHYVALTGTPWDDSASDAFGSHVSPNILRERGGRVGGVSDNALVALVDRTGRVAAYNGSVEFKTKLNAVWTQAGGDKNTVGIERLASSKGQSPFATDVIWQDPQGERWIFRFTGDAQEVGPALLNKNREFSDGTLPSMLDGALRLFSRAVTQWTMAFAPINMMRDLQEKSVLIRSRGVIDASGQPVDVNKLFARTWSNSIKPDLWRAAWALANGKQADNNTAAGRYANQLVMNGGISTFGERLKRGQKSVNTAVKAKSGPHLVASRLGKVVEAYNTLFELISSLSSHAAMRDLGVEEKTAAFQTLDLMNFGNQGAKTAWLRHLYAFFNPAMQSGGNLIRQLNTKRGVTDASIMLMVAGLLYGLAEVLAPRDEEDGEEGISALDKRGAFEIERNVPLFILGNDQPVKVPVGFGLPQLAWSSVVNSARWMSGRYGAQEAVAQQAAQFFKTISPIPPSEVTVSAAPALFFTKMFTPTVFRPIVDLATDTNAFGGKLTAYYPDQSKFRSEQGKITTPDAYKRMAAAMRESTGWDAYPEQWKTLVEGTAWGPLGYVLKSITDSSKELEGRELDAIDRMPGSTLLRLVGGDRLIGGMSRYLESKYHEELTKAMRYRREESLAKAEDRLEEWREDNPEKLERLEALRVSQKRINDLTKRYNELLRSAQRGSSDINEIREELGAISDERKAQMIAFLRDALEWDEEEI